MRAYSGQSFKPTKRSHPWRFLIYLILGFIGGFVAATALSVRQPVELVISTPRQDFPAENLGGQASQDANILAEVWSDSSNISVRTPQPNTIVKSPLVVDGLARLTLPLADGKFGGVVRLKDAKGVEVVKVATTGTAPEIGIYGSYRTELIFEKPKTKIGTLEVFQNSPKDGKEIDKVIVPIRFE